LLQKTGFRYNGYNLKGGKVDSQIVENVNSSLALIDYTIHSMLKGGESDERILTIISIINKNYNSLYTAEQLGEEILTARDVLNQTDGWAKRRNVQQEIENLIDFRGSGTFTITDVYVDLKMDTKEDKAACRMALSRLVARQKIEKIETGKTGTYRLVKKLAEMTRFVNGDGRKFPVKLPVDLGLMCNIHPKNIIVVAGSKSAGKTAMLMEIASLNQHNLPVVYLNSDMGDEEYTDRMKKKGFTCQEDIKFETYNRSSDFHDLITPEKKIFIIDFLEVHENFFEIGKPIKQIWDRLKDGIAIIAIQMKSGGTIGRGGDFSKEKARLYLTMDYMADFRCTNMRIEEAKSPTAAYPDGVRGWSRKVKIVDGCKFSPLENWHV
jgi:hypothetical protein